LVFKSRRVITGEPSPSSAVTIPRGPLLPPPPPPPPPPPTRKPKSALAVAPLFSDTTRAWPAAGTVGVNPVRGTTRMENGPLFGSFGLPWMTSGPSPAKE
jgi:hypothetical protein